MEERQIRVLLVEDHPPQARLMQECLRGSELGGLFETVWVDRLSQALDRLGNEHFDAILLDLSLPDSHGLQTVVRANQRAPATPIVVLTSLADEAMGIEAVRQGAQDYLVKGQADSPLLGRAIRYAIERKAAELQQQRHLEGLAALLRISQQVLAETTPSGLMQRIVEAARELTGAKVGTCGHRLADGSYRTTAFSHSQDGPPCQFGQSFALSHSSVLAKLLKDTLSVRYSQAELEARVQEVDLPAWHVGLRGLLGARLVWSQRTMNGLILVSDKADGTDFTAQDEALLVQLAALGSLGLQHVEAREQEQSRAAELNAVFEAMVEPVVIYDAQGRSARANTAALMLHAGDVTELSSAKKWQLLGVRRMDGQPMPLDESPGQRALRGEMVACEFRAAGPGGSELAFQANAAPLKSGEQIVGAVSVWHDVTERQRLMNELQQARNELEVRVRERTAELAAAIDALQEEVMERRRAEAELRESRQRMQEIVQSAPIVLWAVDKHGVFTLSDGKGLELMQLEPGQLVGSNVHDFVRGNPVMADQVARVLAGHSVEGDVISQGRIWQCRYVPLRDEAGQFTGAIGVSLDVTETRQLEQEILQISSSERKRIGQDLHDALGQTLTGMAFLCKVLQKKLGNRKLPEERDAEELTGLSNLAIRQTRSMARGLIPVELKADGLMTALHELAVNSRSMFGIDCDFNCPVAVLLEDNATATHLYHIAQEAISNAVKHGVARKVVIELLEQDGRMQLSIHDDGKGLAADSRRAKGMGLKIMDYRARVIGGKLDLHQRHGGGTVVSCSFCPRPRSHTAGQAGPAA